MTEETSQAVVPITEALPELRAEEYADVCEWDAARMQLAEGYEAADGEYLIKIRAALKHGLWKRYLEARGIPYDTALYRIHRAEGHVVTPRKNVDSTFLSPSSPNGHMEAPTLRSSDRLFQEYQAGGTTKEELATKYGTTPDNVDIQVSRQAAKRYFEEHPPAPEGHTIHSRSAAWWDAWGRLAGLMFTIRTEEEGLLALLETAETPSLEMAIRTGERSIAHLSNVVFRLKQAVARQEAGQPPASTIVDAQP